MLCVSSGNGVSASAVLRWVLLVLLSQALLSKVYAESVAWGQEGEWKTLESEHFSIHFLPQMQSSAIYALSIAEQVHEELVPFFGSAPELRTRMVLTDDVDWSNGWATPLPYPQIRLYASPPQSDSSLARYDDWLQLLIRHEYVHILHMEMASSAAKGSRSLFGRWAFSFPHMFTPSMILEGLAVYLETNKERGIGRLGSSFYEMSMAAEVANGLDDYQQVLAAQRDWPYNKAYLYGAYFVDFLARRYGETAIKRYLKINAMEVIPYFAWRASFARAFGYSLDKLWDQFRADMKSRFGSVANQSVIKQRQPEFEYGSATQPLDLIPTRKKVLISERDDLLVYQANGSDKPILWRYEGKDGSQNRQAVFHPDRLISASMGSKGTLAYSRLVYEPSGTAYGDVYLRTEKGEELRLTERFRARQLVWLPDESGLLVNRIVNGLSELLLLNLNGDYELIWRGLPGEVLSGFDISPSGERIIASMKRSYESWNLEVFDRAAGNWRSVTQTRGIETDPEWIDDERILFSADYSGRFQVYQLAANSIEPASSTHPLQLTEALFGAFTPKSINGVVAFQNYSADGYQLYQTAISPNSYVVQKQVSDHKDSSVHTNETASYPQQLKELQVTEADVESYRVLPSLMPTSWFPSWAFTDHQNEVGASVWGQDTLSRHAFSLAASHNFKYQLTNLQFAYGYDTRWQLVAQRTHDYIESDDIRLLQRDALLLGRLNLINGLEGQLALHAGSYFERDRYLKNPPATSSGSDGQGLVGAALAYDSRRILLNSPGVGYGNYSYLVVETNDVLESDYEGEVIQASMQQNWDLTGPDGLSLTIQAGLAEEGGKSFQLGGFQLSSLFGRTRVGLPGYASGIQYGEGYHYEQLEWRHWLGRVERNWNSWPLGLGDYYLSARLEGAQTWTSNDVSEWLPSASLELNSELVLGFRLVIPATLGVTKGLGAGGEASIYAGLSLPM